MYSICRLIYVALRNNPGFLAFVDLVTHRLDILVLDLEEEDQRDERDDEQSDGKKEVHLEDSTLSCRIKSRCSRIVSNECQERRENNSTKGDADLYGNRHKRHRDTGGILACLPMAPGR